MEKTKTKYSKNLYKVFPYYKKYKKLWALEIITLVLLSIVGIFTPIISANFLASLSTLDFQMAITLIIYSVIINVINPLISYVNAYVYVKVAFKVEQDIRFDLINAITTTKMSKCDETNNGIFIERINSDVGRCSDALLDVFNTVLEIISNTAFFIYIAFLNIWFFLILLGYVIVCFVFDNEKEKKWWKDWKKIKDLREISTGAYGEQVRALRDIKSLNIRENTIADSDRKIERTLNESLKARKTRRNYILVRDFVSMLFLTGFLLLGIFFIKEGVVPLSVFLIVYSYSGNAKNLARHLAAIKEYITQGEICAYRVFEVIEKFPKEEFGDKDIEAKHGELEFKDVTFGYSEDKEVLHNVSIKFEANKTTAIVGRSGCGKSTILSLSNKLYSLKENSGVITIDGENINDLTEKSLRNSISTVTQTPYIFNATIRENMQYIKPDVTDEEIVKTLKKAQIYDFVKALPEGLNSKVGENGVMLSGGQKQRFAIARILLKNPKIIILDEATSALDNENQEKIVEVVDNLKNDHTIIVVAHRLSTIVDADKIVVIDNGTVVGEGSHKYLMRNCPLYKALYNKEEKSQLLEDAIIETSEDVSK